MALTLWEARETGFPSEQAKKAWLRELHEASQGLRVYCHNGGGTGTILAVVAYDEEGDVAATRVLWDDTGDAEVVPHTCLSGLNDIPFASEEMRSLKGILNALKRMEDD